MYLNSFKTTTVIYTIFTCVDTDPYSEYGFRSTKFLNTGTDPNLIWIYNNVHKILKAWHSFGLLHQPPIVWIIQVIPAVMGRGIQLGHYKNFHVIITIADVKGEELILLINIQIFWFITKI